jgi:hypothetical protein
MADHADSARSIRPAASALSVDGYAYLYAFAWRFS